jgi:hypothetical protein
MIRGFLSLLLVTVLPLRASDGPHAGRDGQTLTVRAQ